MMSALSPALDTTAAAPVTAAPAGEGGESSPFAAVIQGLSPAAEAVPDTMQAAPAAALPATATGAVQASLPAGIAVPATAADSDPLTGALVSVLQALGISDKASGPALATQDDATSDIAASSDDPIPASLPDPIATLLPAVPVLPPSPPIMPATPALTAAKAGTAPSTEADLALTTTGSPAQQQARQWLAALAPAQTTSDSTSADTPVAAPLLPQQPQAAATPAPLQTPVIAAGSGWLQQPLASFFNMAPTSSDSGPAIADLAATTPDSLSLTAEAPKGLPSALNFAQTLSSTSASTTAPVLATVLPHALQDPAWSDAFGQRVAMLAQQGTQTATLQLNPPELGPIQVRIALGEQGARVEFNTAQQTTSDLIETAMPRLAAAFEHQGLRLDDTRVNLISNRNDVFSAPSAFASTRQDTPQGDRGQSAQQQAQSSARQAPTSANPETGINASNVIRLPLPPKSGIDYYA